MNQPEEWVRLAARIKGLGAAAETLCRGVGAVDRGSGAASGWIIRSANELVDLLEDYRGKQAADLSVAARAALDRRVSDLVALKRSSGGGFDRMLSLCTALLALESELTYHLTDLDTMVRPLIERAFIHLRRSLVVDSGLRSRWKAAFDGGGETKCEQLGAIHLLQHGIYAFKTDAEGARTDLVLGERLLLDTETKQAMRGLVLTEWKLARESTEIERRVAEAVQQAKLYSEELLAGFEVQSARYIVVVSKDRVKLPPDTFDGDVLYRNVNIAIEPSVPSKGARG